MGCASHCYSLELKDTFKESEIVIEKVCNIMKALRKLILLAVLRRKTHLLPVIDTITRWSSTANMILRYTALRESLKDMDINDKTINLLNKRDDGIIDKLCERYKQLDEVTKELPKDSTTCTDVRALFDTVIADFLVPEKGLSHNATRIMHNPTFESALV